MLEGLLRDTILPVEMARAQGAEVIDFNAEDPIKALRIDLGYWCGSVIDAVGVDANRPHSGRQPNRRRRNTSKKRTNRSGSQTKNSNWEPGCAVTCT